MIKIAVASYNNEALMTPLSAVFGQEGGTLGRSDDNHFVLPDPKKMVSRSQALIKSDGAHHTIINLSKASPILINGKEIAGEGEHELKVGDEIRVGLYLLRAQSHLTAVETSSEQDVVDLVSPMANAGSVDANPAAVAEARDEPVETAGQAGDASAEKNENSAAADVLIQAFLKGAGIPDVTLSTGLTPELMEMIGKLLAIAVQGTVDLSALRAMIKREVKAEVTMVVVRNNNPVKFFPDGQTVLTQMLRKKMPGFMGPIEAMEDAYEDLQAHQIGVVAGTRAAIGDVVNRFDPDALEKSSKGGILDSILPLSRKARLWDSHTELFQNMKRQANDDFEALVGKAFVDAYEKEIERFKDRKHGG